MSDLDPTASELAELGADRAAAHADDVEPRWTDRAFELLAEYASTHAQFMVEDARQWAHKTGFPEPPNARAWGAVVQRACREKLIVRAGYRKTSNPSAHATPASLWQSTIYSEAA